MSYKQARRALLEGGYSRDDCRQILHIIKCTDQDYATWLPRYVRFKTKLKGQR